MQSPPIKCLTQELLDEVAASSRSSPRGRQNYNFHDLSEKVQRFVNVLQLGTYVRPHRHLRPPAVNGFEFFAVIQGEVGILILNENGQILRSLRVGAAGPTRAVELPEGTIHTLVALAADTVILEFKEGPYDAAADKDFLPGFPAEGSVGARELVRLWEAEFKS
ncbi:WbuC family cupin fold metalloprotein [Microcoleus sp. LEGE 07076]|uniref:WbuC family cupin fold metalloprotein n=1 Tax=Microcoleus sp. LEGE 07076 TaxID=915322 RepID=UPI00188177A8|nr:WbuC family cupin fold metalloprotein [Microcoleus sp. LEGE 07076]